MASPIRNISDTALWAAMFRAAETERHDGLFRDPFAARLGGERGAEIMSNVPGAASNAWAWVMRTYLFDRLIHERLADGVSLVLNLAAGLDARPYRLDEAAHVRWVEVDLPDLLAYKNEVLFGERSKGRLEQVALDLSDRAARRELFARLGGGLVLSEGLLIYFTEEEVTSLATDLAAAGFDWWAMDLSSPALMRMLQQTTGRDTAQAGAPMRFAPENRAAFFEPFGWTPVETHSIFETAMAHHRVPAELLMAPPPPEAGDIWSGVCLLRRSAR
ncbi:MAG TPA: SAM-dependent methyltransferase [Bryobacteraceae bacterium]|jgi:methyltransferase (TIGR00027 family)|nr:SAM-dependent methyltransferase [Bryobacteraceae bacterium]